MLWKNGQPKVLISTPLSMFGASSLLSYVEESILFHNTEDLRRELLLAWENIDVEFTAKLIEIMPRRCQAVIDSKGDVTKY
jgi:hypothetical protein